MSQANPNANVTLSFEGIAIYNLNNGNNFWEFLFLRHLLNHNLDVKIIKNTPDVPAQDKVLIHSFRIGKGHNILIDAPAAIAPPDDKTRFEIEDFSFDAANEKEDIRWMEELSEEEVHTSCSFRSDFPKRDLAFLSINGKSILYTQKLSKDIFDIWERIGNKMELRATRNVGVVVAADIQYPADQSISMRVEGVSGFTLELPVKEGSLYEIVFNNTCDNVPTANQTSDFQHYYDLFSPTERRIELIAKPILDANGNVDLEAGKPGETAACKCRTCRKLIGFNSLSEIGAA